LDEIRVFRAPILLSKADEQMHHQHQHKIELLNFSEHQLDRSLVILEQSLIAPIASFSST
jgi:hypothetical protein